MRWYSHNNKLWLHVLLAFCAVYFVLYHIGPALQHHFFEEPLPLPHRLDTSKLTSPYPLTSELTTNLVVASVRSDNTSWTDRLHDLIPNLKIIRYVSDDPNAQYHPPAPKAREALMYFTYLKDFYKDLADVNIFVHAEETSWHMDAALRKSLIFGLAQLDLTQVVKRGYVNLRTTAGGSVHDCPDGFNTSKTALESPKGEESLMGPAFRANFPSEPVPAILAGPCCSQFAVSRAAILSRPRKQYQRSAQFLVDSEWSDQMVGRPWERMWSYLFQKWAIDCNSEWRMLCRMYGVCFAGGEEEHQSYESLWGEKVRLEEQAELLREIWRPGRLRKIDNELEQMLEKALDHGLDVEVREEAGSALRAESS